MLLGLVAVVLAQSSQPGVAVVISRTTGVTRERAVAVSREVEDVLKAQGVPVAGDAPAWSRRAACVGENDPATCDGDAACLAKLAGKLEVPIIVGVEVGAIDSDLALRVVAIEAEKGQLLAERTVIASGTQPLAAPLTPELAEFSTTVSRAVPPPRPKPAAPVVVIDTPVAPAPAGPSVRAFAWAPAIAGGALAATGLYFLGQAQARSDTLSGEGSARGIDLAQAAELRAQGTQAQTVGVVMVASAGAAFAASAAMLLFGGPKQVQVSAIAGPSGGAVVARGSF